MADGISQSFRMLPMHLKIEKTNIPFNRIIGLTWSKERTLGHFAKHRKVLLRGPRYNGKRT